MSDRFGNPLPIKAYHVEIDPNNPGCPHCAEGKCWEVVDRKGTGIGGRTFGNREDADDFCEWLNMAHEEGVEDGREAQP